MNTIKNNLEEHPDDHQKGWLNLALAPSLGKSCSNSKPTASTKIYTCSFCKRKFYSSQALGGHQNAHRRERDAARRYYSSNAINAFDQSLMLHSSVQKPRRNAEKTVSKFTENGAQYGVAWEQAPYVGEEEANMMKWPGGFYLYPQPASPQADPCWLDLNLKL